MACRFNGGTHQEGSTMKAQIQADLKEAMKAGKAAERDALRLLLADLMKEEKDKGVDLTDEVATTVINRIIKRTKAAIEEYGNLGQADTVTKLETELVVNRPSGHRARHPLRGGHRPLQRADRLAPLVGLRGRHRAPRR